MPCYLCRSEFSFFKREHSCKNCGFSFCSTCLKKEIEVPKTKQVGKVCDSCFKAITSGSQRDPSKQLTDDMIPENFRKRVAALEKKNSRPAPYPKKAPVVRQDTVEQRLENLRKERLQNVPSVEVIEERLAALRDQKPVDNPSMSGNNILITKNRSAEEETKDLLNQQWERNQIDSGTGSTSDATPSHVLLGKTNQPGDTVEDILAQAKQEAELDEKKKQKEDEDIKAIQERLGKLQGFENVGDPSLKFNTEELSEEEQVRILIKKLSEEARMDSAIDASWPSATTNKKSEDEEDEDAELPWCCICNEDATIRCFDCDNDLFCRRCYKQCHDGPDAKHRTTAFRKPSGHQ